MLDEIEYSRWMKSAELTARSARDDLRAGSYNWVCFKAHQAVEKALKALLWGCGRPRTGRSLVRLLRSVAELGIEVPEEIEEHCARLSKYYGITRYPNMWESGIPEEYFTRGEAEEALERCERVLEWVERVWRELSKSAKP